MNLSLTNLVICDKKYEVINDMEVKASAGYSGLYRQPYANASTYGDTIYLIPDQYHQEMNVLILTPGAYRDLYRILSAPTYQRVNLFIPSVDTLFISDLFRLVCDLRKIKSEVRWYYPEPVNGITPKNMLFETAQIRSNYFKSERISNCTIEFKLANTLDDNHRFYDFEVCDGSSYDYFTLYLDEEKLDMLVSNFSNTSAGVERIHIPYNTVFYGGLTGKEAGEILGKKSYYLVMNNFKCREEFIECNESQKYGFAKRVIA